MQDPSTFQQHLLNPQTQQQLQFPEQEQHLKCPRCDSTNTKFCYYNNYNLSQPRHYCKNCRRYWTKGGALRNIPVGGGSRKNTKRQKRASPSSSASNSKTDMPAIFTPAVSPAEQDHRMLDMSGSFSSLLTSNGQFGNFGDFPGNSNSLGNQEMDLHGNHNSDGLLGNSSSWVDGNGNGWPDLSIYTPGSRFHQ